LKGDCKSR